MTGFHLGTERTRLTWVLAGACAALLPPSGVAGRAAAGPLGKRPPSRMLLNVAVDAMAVASSEQVDHPAALATDGNAATSWCSTGATGELTVDLGGTAEVSGLGLSLAGAAGEEGEVEISVATSQEHFHRLGPAFAVPVATPSWVSVTAGDAGPVAARYVRIRVAGDSAACIGELRVLGPAGRRHGDRGPDRLPAIGYDMSFAVQEAAIGNEYEDRGEVGLPEQILAAHGGNAIRLRLWLDPPGGYSDLTSVLTMARRARAAGMRLLLDFHYSDFWADPQTQNTPAAWQGQDLATLADTVRVYTRDVLAALHAQGTPADLVQIGNEIRNGMLWPTGRIDWSAGTGWDNLGTLLRAGVAGAADAPGQKPRIVIHFDQGGDNGFSRAFFDNIVAQQVPFDVIGLSYYPFWHGTITQLRANMADLAARYDKDVMVVETQYGWTLANGDALGNFLWQESQVIPGYPATPGGQLAFVSDLLSALAAVPHGRGTGLFYWQPEWIPGVGWTPGQGTPNDNLTFFDFAGESLPAVQFTDPLRACRQYSTGESPCTF